LKATSKAQVMRDSLGEEQCNRLLSFGEEKPTVGAAGKAEIIYDNDTTNEGKSQAPPFKAKRTSDGWTAADTPPPEFDIISARDLQNANLPPIAQDGKVYQITFPPKPGEHMHYLAGVALEIEKYINGVDVYTVKNSKKEIVLAALLVNPTVREAAASVGIPETTAYNHLRDPEFATEYKQRKRQVVGEASDYLQSQLNAAAQVITGIMNDSKVSARTRLEAARAVMEFGYARFEQAEIIARIEALEASVDDTGR